MKYLFGVAPTDIQYAMAEALQDYSTDMQLPAGRGAGKSVLTSILASWFRCVIQMLLLLFYLQRAKRLLSLLA